MKARIFKYPLEITGVQTVAMPTGARPLSVGEQDRRLMLWALIDKDAPPVDRTVRVLGTGHPVEDPAALRRAAFVGTVQMPNGLVWHVFVENESKRWGSS